MSMDFEMDALPMAQARDDGLSANECYPQMLVNDPSFALLNEDTYFARNGRTPDPRWANPPDAQLIAGRNPPFRKRDVAYLNANEFFLENSNSSRRLTQEELDEVVDAVEMEEHFRMLDKQMEELAYVECVGDACATQVTPLGRESIALPAPARTAPSVVDATATATTELIISAGAIRSSGAVSRSGLTMPAVPEFTGLVRHEDLKVM